MRLQGMQRRTVAGHQNDRGESQIVAEAIVYWLVALNLAVGFWFLYGIVAAECERWRRQRHNQVNVAPQGSERSAPRSQQLD